MKARKILVSIAAVALVAAISIGGTLAWLTDKTENVVNTFTVGNVNIKLDETNIENPTGDRAQDGNKYEELMPGYTYTKDPTVTVLEGSEKCYVRVFVAVQNIDKLKAAIPGNFVIDENGKEVFLLQNLVNGWDNAVWQYAGYQGTEKAGAYEFRYVKDGGIVNANTVLPALFTSFTIPDTLGKTELANLVDVEIDIVANAIQADGFTATVDADGNETASAMENAWAAWADRT